MAGSLADLKAVDWVGSKTGSLADLKADWMAESLAGLKAAWMAESLADHMAGSLTEFSIIDVWFILQVSTKIWVSEDEERLGNNLNGKVWVLILYTQSSLFLMLKIDWIGECIRRIHSNCPS